MWYWNWAIFKEIKTTLKLDLKFEHLCSEIKAKGDWEIVLKIKCLVTNSEIRKEWTTNIQGNMVESQKHCAE